MKSPIRTGAALLAAAGLSMAGAPAAQASAVVCNQATAHWLGGGLVALDPPTNSPAARYTVDLGKLPGQGAAGLYDAALNSPSLTLCEGDDVIVYPTFGEPTDVDPGVIGIN